MTSDPTTNHQQRWEQIAKRLPAHVADACEENAEDMGLAVGSQAYWQEAIDQGRAWLDNQADQGDRDHAEETYNANLCPGCDYSPCIAGERGACLEEDTMNTEQEPWQCEACGEQGSATRMGAGNDLLNHQWTCPARHPNTCPEPIEPFGTCEPTTQEPSSADLPTCRHCGQDLQQLGNGSWTHFAGEEGCGWADRDSDEEPTTYAEPSDTFDWFWCECDYYAYIHPSTTCEPIADALPEQVGR